MKYLKKYFGVALLLLILPILLLLSCSKKKESASSSPTDVAVTCASSRSLTASNKVPLLVVRVQYANARFQSSETTWANKFFGSSDGQLNHYLAETTYSNYQFMPATETSGCTNDGVVTVSMAENHPDTQKGDVERYDCYAAAAITSADTYVNFAAYDTDSNDNISVSELQVMFVVAGGESASGLNSPGGVWGQAGELYCDVDLDGFVRTEEGESFVTLDNVSFMGRKDSAYGQNGFSQFGERQQENGNNWDATIGIIAHELGHAYFLLPDLYDTSSVGEGIGNFGLMGTGAWSRKSINEKGGATPIHLSAWSKEKIGVCVPQTVDSGTKSYTLPAVYQSSIHRASCGIYKATTSTSGEYFLFENRSSGGYDRGLGLLWDISLNYYSESNYIGGVAIWHVKDILSSCYTRESNNCEAQSPKLVDLEEANDAGLDNASTRGNTTHLFYSSNSATFNNSSSPNSKLYDNSSSGISATSISAAGDSMTLTISK
jgi:M6 family metalloprotease-like protein